MGHDNTAQLTSQVLFTCDHSFESPAGSFLLARYQSVAQQRQPLTWPCEQTPHFVHFVTALPTGPATRKCLGRGAFRVTDDREGHHSQQLFIAIK